MITSLLIDCAESTMTSRKESKNRIYINTKAGWLSFKIFAKDLFDYLEDGTFVH